MPKSFGLGKGLESLIPKLSKTKKPTNNFVAKKLRDQITEVEINKIKPNPYQPRKDFNKAKLDELAESIKRHGIIQPLIVTETDGDYQLVSGERRLEAAKIAGLSAIPVIIRDVEENQKLEVALVENIQRHDLNPIEEARAFKYLIDNFNLTQEEVAKKIGKSRVAITNTLRLLDLPIEIQRAIIDDRITEGHARAILTLTNKEKRLALFKEILNKKLTVRQTESRIKKVSVRRHIRTIVEKDPYIKEIEDRLQEILGTKVTVNKGKKGGVINIEFYSKEELESIYDKISQID